MPKSKGRRKPKRNATPPPPPKPEVRESGPVYTGLMFGLMAVGVVVIVLNYIGLFGGDFNRPFLWGGLAAIGAGFLMTLNYN